MVEDGVPWRSDAKRGVGIDQGDVATWSLDKQRFWGGLDTYCHPLLDLHWKHAERAAGVSATGVPNWSEPRRLVRRLVGEFATELGPG